MKSLIRIPVRKLSVSHQGWMRSWPKPDYGPMEVQRSVLLNGMRVAAAKPLGSQIGACTVMYQAGSRFEDDDYLGVSHFLRAASCASSCAFSGYTKMRYMSQQGASLTCTSDRQSIAYTLRCPVTTFSEMKCFLLDTVLRNCFKEWEMDDLKPMIKDDLHRIHPEQRVIDLAQKACWAGPLGNSLFCLDCRIGNITGDHLNSFTSYHYKTDHCTVASVGVPFEETMKMAEAIEPRREKPPPRPHVPSFPRRGFELFDLGPCADTWICVVVPGCGTNDLANLIKHSIIAHACGTVNVQDGSHHMDRTPQQPLGLMSGEDVHTTYRAFNISYYDTGVFGIVAKTRAHTAWNVATAAAEFLTNVGDLNFKQIDVGKKRLKVSLALHDEHCVKLTEGLALQLASGFQIDSAKTSMTMIDQITNDEISCTAKSLSDKYKDMAIAVVGDVGRVPHNKELICGF
uniref:Peptidase M16 N-terminal domain-containing protein n=1 Tax=Heliothis virescens TaxID=7102 RepID=A0A2A4JJ05_HELVI